jgi:hypothetical protein
MLFSTVTILRAVTVAEFMVESFYSRARQGNRRISGYVTVSATQPTDKRAEQKSAIVAARSIGFIFLQENKMKEEIKQRLQKKEIWQRGLYILLFIAIGGFSKFLIINIMFFQYVTMVLTGKKNELLLGFSQNLSTYIYQIIVFLSFNSDQRPFPFSAWPNSTPNDNELIKDE